MVELVSIIEVAERNGLELRPVRYHPGQYQAHCPECGDHGRRRNLEINAEKNGGVFHCWACGAHGGAVTFHAWLRGISFEAAKAELYPSKPISSSNRPKRRQHPAESLTREQLMKIGFERSNFFKRPATMDAKRWYEYRRDTLDWIWRVGQ